MSYVFYHVVRTYLIFSWTERDGVIGVKIGLAREEPMVVIVSVRICVGAVAVEETRVCVGQVYVIDAE
jgi:hypothetical protein